MPVNEISRQRRNAREVRLVAEFLATHFPNDPSATYIRLGAVTSSLIVESLDESERKYLQNWTRFADGLVYRERELILIEGYVLPELGKPSQLLTYMRIFWQTPGMERHRGKTLRGIIVGPIVDPVLVSVARDFGLEFRLFRPPWIVEYLWQVAPRHALREFQEDQG